MDSTLLHIFTSCFAALGYVVDADDAKDSIGECGEQGTRPEFIIHIDVS